VNQVLVGGHFVFLGVVWYVVDGDVRRRRFSVYVDVQCVVVSGY
jgi:hypothetical protein